MVKSREAKTLIQDLEGTFASLREVDLRLNPEKCSFGVPSGKFLGFLMSHRGIEANPEKVKVIDDMSPPQTLKEMQKLTGHVTALGRFISKLGERALPFFKMMKKKGPFEWTEEANKAFQDLKRYLTSPSVMVAPRPQEPLVLYLAATPYSASAALVALGRSVGPRPQQPSWLKQSRAERASQRPRLQPRRTRHRREAHPKQRRPLLQETSRWGLRCLRRRPGLRRTLAAPALPT